MTDAPQTLLTAAWVAPVAAPMVRDGGVVFAGGRVVAVGPAAELRRQHPAATVHDAGAAVVLPGLVNAHVHLELSHLTPGERPARFVDWLLRLMSQPPADPAVSVQSGIDQCRRFGVTAVGDVTGVPRATRPVLSASNLAGVSYGEVRGMARRRSLLGDRLAAAAEPIASDRIRSGVSPHAPYSVELDGYQQCLAAAQAADLPLMTHLAETPDEARFLAEHGGPFRELWAVLDAWDDAVPTAAGGPVRAMAELGLLAYTGTLLAHVNHCDDAELALLAGGRASVAYCPRTHAYFGHRPHRWRAMLAAGVNVAVGTDSTASSPDLNLVDDLRLLHAAAPDVDSATLWSMATTRAAKAIGDDRVGRLTVGAAADAVVFAAAGDEPLREVLESPEVPSAVWAAGVRV